MNKLKLIIVLGLSSLGVAQSQYFYNPAAGGTNNIAATTTNTLSQIVLTRNTRIIAIEQRFKLTGSGTDSTILHIDGSVNGGTYVNDALTSITNAQTGTTAVTNVVHLDTLGFLTLRFRVENTSSTRAITNYYLGVSTKTGVMPSIPLELQYGGTAGSTAYTARSGIGVTELTTNNAAQLKTAIGLQSGTVILQSNGLGTNTFTTAFASAPVVVMTLRGSSAVVATNQVTAITTTNFTCKGAPGETNSWIAVGAP